MSNSDTLKVKTYNKNYTCSIMFYNRNATAKRLTMKYKKTLKINPTWKCKVFKETVKNDYSVRVSDMKCYRARKKAMDEIRGS